MKPLHTIDDNNDLWLLLIEATFNEKITVKEIVQFCVTYSGEVRLNVIADFLVKQYRAFSFDGQTLVFTEPKTGKISKLNISNK